MQAGKLRHEILIQQPNTVTDEFGAQTITWSDFVTLFAAIDSVVSDEVATTPGVPVEITTLTFLIRYVPGVTSDMRVRFENRTFKVNSVVDLQERHTDLVLRCTELGR